MLRITNSFIASELISISEDNIIKRVDGGNMTNETSIVSKANTRFSKSRTRFFIFRTRLAFIELRQAFIKAPILYYFDSKCHICIKTNTLNYTISGVLNQLTLNSLG